MPLYYFFKSKKLLISNFINDASTISVTVAMVTVPKYTPREFHNLEFLQVPAGAAIYLGNLRLSSELLHQYLV